MIYITLILSSLHKVQKDIAKMVFRAVFAMR